MFDYAWMRKIDDGITCLIKMSEIQQKELKAMALVMDDILQKVADTRGKVESLITLTAGLSGFIRDNANDPTAMQKLADDLDATAAETQAAIDANPLPGAA